MTHRPVYAFGLLAAAWLLALCVPVAAQEQATVRIVSPAGGTPIYPGETIAVEVDVPWQVDWVRLGGSLSRYAPYDALVRTSSPYTFQILVPAGVEPRRYSLRAIIGRANGVTESADVFVFVEPPGSLNALEAVPDAMLMRYRGERQKIDVYGDTADGTHEFLNGSKIDCQSGDSSIAAVGPGCTVIAVSQGETAVEVVRGALSTIVPVQIRPSDQKGDFDVSGGIDASDFNFLEQQAGEDVSATGDDRDLNADGSIDLEDVRELENLCGPDCFRDDHEPPTVNCEVPSSSWSKVNVDVRCEVGDDVAGLAKEEEFVFLLATNVPQGVEDASAATDSRRVCDRLGKCATAGPVVGNRIDRRPPSITAPGNVIVTQTGADGATVNYPAPVIMENGSGLASSSCSPASGSVFPVGSTAVTCSAADAVGNRATANFTISVTPADPPDELNGRMHGNGYIADNRTHHHFVFRVAQRGGQEYGRLDYWVIEPRVHARGDDDYSDDRNGQHDREYGRERGRVAGRFEATAITSVLFSDDPDFGPRRRLHAAGPSADSVTFAGRGRWNGRSGYTFEATATDQGEPGRGRDTFALKVIDAQGKVVASVDGVLGGGKVQSTRLRR
jgi:hypothetical protein